MLILLGMEANMGYVESSSRLLNTFYAVWNIFYMLPEELDYRKLYKGKIEANLLYPLRPELIESTYHHYMATEDNTWLSAGIQFLDTIENYMQAPCGYAGVEYRNGSMTVIDEMPSFFLSETLKYLYLLFDRENFINKRPYIFSTEAHPFDSVQISELSLQSKYQHFDYSSEMKKIKEQTSMQSAGSKDSAIFKPKAALPSKCRKREWNENAYTAYDPNYDNVLANEAAITKFMESDEMLLINLPGFVKSLHVRHVDPNMPIKPNSVRNEKRFDVCYEADNHVDTSIETLHRNVAKESHMGRNENRFKSRNLDKLNDEEDPSGRALVFPVEGVLAH
jgi:hypothetical protein